MPGVGDSSRQARRGLRCAFGPVPAATAVCSLVPSAANPSPTLEWGTGPRPEKRQNSLSSSPLSAAHPDTANPSSCTRSDTSHSGDAQHPISARFLYRNSGLSTDLLGGAFWPDLWHPLPSMLPRRSKANVDIEASVCVSAALPPSCSLADCVHCSVHLRRAKCPQCPIPGLPLSHNATGHLYAHFYIYLLVCRIHDVFPVFVGVENIEPALDWNKIQISVQLKLKSLSKGIQANLKV